MPGIQIMVEKHVERGHLVDVYVVVDGATRGKEVTIRVEQMDGAGGQPAAQSKMKIANFNGRATANFSMIFAAEGKVTLVVSASENGPAVFPPESKTVTVT
jgi:hypothetical protein